VSETSPRPARRRRDLLVPLLAFLFLILVVAFIVFRPFVLTFAVAASVSLLLNPVQGRLRALGAHPTVAAGLLVLVTVAVILLPILGSIAILGQQSLAVLDWVRPRLARAELQTVLTETLPSRSPWLRDWLPPLMPLVSDALDRLASAANTLIQGVVTGVTYALFELVIFTLMLFFLLRDGGRLRAELRQVSPFSDAQETQVFDHLSKTVKGVLQAMVVVPLVQGILAGVGFWIFGVPSPLVWGVMVVFAALVPVLGSPLGWVPAAVYLYVTGPLWPAVGLALYGTVVISGADNVIKPLLLKGTAQIHPMLGFLSILGGVISFGPTGLLIGPVVLSLVLSAFRIYRLDVLRAPPVPEGDVPSPS
jgi:predicted PurR-regulated permease PerM